MELRLIFNSVLKRHQKIKIFASSTTTDLLAHCFFVVRIKAKIVFSNKMVSDRFCDYRITTKCHFFSRIVFINIYVASIMPGKL
jgi:hypothetical protein